MAPAKGQEGIVALEVGVELVHLQLRHEAVKAATLGGIAHLLRCHGNKGNVCLEAREALDGRVRDGVCGIVAVERRGEQVQAGGRRVGVGVANDQASGRNGVRDGRQVRRAVLGGKPVALFGGQGNAREVAHRALGHRGGRNATGVEQAHPQHVGRRVARRSGLAGGDVVNGQARGDLAQRDAGRLAVNHATLAVVGLGHLAHPAVGPVSGLLARCPDLDAGLSAVYRDLAGVDVRKLVCLVEHVAHVDSLLDGSRALGVYRLVEPLDGAGGILGVDLAVALAEIPEEPQPSQRKSKHQDQRTDKDKPARGTALLLCHHPCPFNRGALLVSARLINEHPHFGKHAL